MKNGIGPKTMVIGLIVGTLSVPALVFAATNAFDGAPDAAEAAPATTTTTTLATVVTQPEETSSTLPEVDLEAACGEDGLSLVAAESDGSITDIQQAALDALRPICEEAGLPLPVPPAPETVVVVEAVEAAATTTAASTSQYEDDEDEEHEDGEYEDEDDDHHEDDEHEDDDD